MLRNTFKSVCEPAKKLGLPKKKVLQICHGYGGPFLDVARQYSDLLASKGYEVHTVYLTGKASSTVSVATGSPVVAFLELTSRDIAGFKLGAIRSIRKLVRGADFKFCLTHRFKAAFIACFATDLPVIAVFHAYATFNRLSRKLFARLFQGRLAILGVSNAVCEDVRRHVGNWSNIPVEMFHNRLNVAAARDVLYGREEARRALGIAPDLFVVGNVGRLHHDKDQATLLRGFALAQGRIPRESKLLIVGSGPLEAALRDLATALGIGERVLFVGELPEAKRYFRAFDIFALSSDHEPFGMVLLEAMVAGVPVVATKAGGVPEIVGEHYPFLFAVGDARAFAQALGDLCSLSQSARDQLVGEMTGRLERRFSHPAASERFDKLKDVLTYL